MALNPQVNPNNPNGAKLCFEIAIYRCNEDEHARDMENEKAKRLAPARAAPHSYAVGERRFDETEWYPWPYNEAIGWIQLSVQESEVTGDVYFVPGRAIKGGMKKRFYWRENFDIDVSLGQSSADIYNAICAKLEEVWTEDRYRKWHLDAEAFRNTGPFVDWRGLVDSCGSNGRNGPVHFRA